MVIIMGIPALRKVSFFEVVKVALVGDMVKSVKVAEGVEAIKMDSGVLDSTGAMIKHVCSFSEEPSIVRLCQVYTLNYKSFA